MRRQPKARSTKSKSRQDAFYELTDVARSGPKKDVKADFGGGAMSRQVGGSPVWLGPHLSVPVRFCQGCTSMVWLLWSRLLQSPYTQPRCECTNLECTCHHSCLFLLLTSCTCSGPFDTHVKRYSETAHQLTNHQRSASLRFREIQSHMQHRRARRCWSWRTQHAKQASAPSSATSGMSLHQGSESASWVLTAQARAACWT